LTIPIFPAKDPDSGQMERVLSLDSLAAAHDAGRAFMWARLREVGGQEGVDDLCKELDIDPDDIIYPPDMQHAEPSQPISLGDNCTAGGAVSAVNPDAVGMNNSSVADSPDPGIGSGAAGESSAQSQVAGVGNWGWLEGWKWPWVSGGAGPDTRGEAASGSGDVSAEAERQENMERARCVAMHGGRRVASTASRQTRRG
jgi:hypothetical protein